MEHAKTSPSKGAVTRRSFLKASAAASAGVLAGGAALPRAFAAGSDTLKVGLIGCGGRGTDAAKNCVAAAPGVQIVALADAFKDRLDGSRNELN